jgi:RimJ/RimL family protein N-acetyltransferase
MSLDMITEEEFIDFDCPYCREPVSFPAQNRGTLQQCPMCFESLLAPETPGEPGRQIPVPISTARLTLRRLAPGDWKDLLEFLSDEETFRYTAGHVLDEDAVLRWLESDPHVKLTTPDQTFYLGLVPQENEKLIGCVGLRLGAPDLGQGTLTVQVNQAFQKQGYGTEAFAALLRFCFREIKLHRISVSCDSRNTAALKLLHKVGLRREGEFVKDSFFHGEWRNTLWHAVLREEFCPPGETPA